MEDYLIKMKTLSDNLKLAGSPISSADLIIQTLTGLDSDYNAIVVQLSDKVNLTWVDLQAQLLAFENRLEQLNNFSNLTINPSVSPSANVATISDYRGNKSFSKRGWRGANQRGFRGGRGRGKTSRGRPVCQLCRKPGHLSANCYYRFDKNYMGQPPEENNQNNFTSQSHSAFIASPHTTQDPEWYFDSGVSNHVTHDSNRFQEITGNDGKSALTVGNGEKMKIVASGFTTINTNKKPLNLNEVLYVPNITKNLLSISKLAADNNILVEFHANHCFVKDKMTGTVLVEGKLKEGLYQMTNVLPQSKGNLKAFLSVKESWHRRLGHPSSRVLEEILKSCQIKVSPSDPFSFCEACQYEKSHLLPFNLSTSHAQEPLDLIHSDVWGPAPINSSSGFRFYVLFIDDFSRYTWIFPLKQKSETLQAFIQFKNQVENQFNKKVKALQCDRGGEYRIFQKLALESGIQLRLSCPYTSTQNGRAERKHRHVVELGLTLLVQAKMPLYFWWKAFSTAVFLINRLPSPVIEKQNPYSLLLGKSPDYSLLKPFGCACYPCLKPYNKHKLQFQTTKCVFLGYSSSHKGYKCISPTGRIYVSRHVVFNEDHFPFHDGFLNTRRPVEFTTHPVSFFYPTALANNNENLGQSNLQEHEAESLGNDDDNNDINQSSSSQNSRTCSMQPNSPVRTTHIHEQSTKEHRTDSSSGMKPQNEEVCSNNAATDLASASPLNTHQMCTRSKVGIFKPKHPYVGMAEKMQQEIEPQSVNEALQRPEWKEAMRSEFNALTSNDTWTLIPYEGQKNVIDSKWVFKTKYKTDGTIERRKARLVAKGFQQSTGIDFDETFSPVIKASTMRVILTFAVHCN